MNSSSLLRWKTSQNLWQSPWKKSPKQFCSSARYCCRVRCNIQGKILLSFCRVWGCCPLFRGECRGRTAEEMRTGASLQFQLRVLYASGLVLYISIEEDALRVFLLLTSTQPTNLCTIFVQKIFYHGGVGYSSAQKVRFNWY